MGRPLDEMTLTVTRRPGAWTDGPWVPGATSTFDIKAGRPQPLGGALLEMLPEGVRSTARFMIYVHDDQAALHLVEDDEDDLAADRIAYKGTAHLATSAESWEDMPLGHKAYILLAWGPDEKVT